MTPGYGAAEDAQSRVLNSLTFWQNVVFACIQKFKDYFLGFEYAACSTPSKNNLPNATLSQSAADRNLKEIRVSMV